MHSNVAYVTPPMCMYPVTCSQASSPTCLWPNSTPSGRPAGVTGHTTQHSHVMFYHSTSRKVDKAILVLRYIPRNETHAPLCRASLGEKEGGTAMIQQRSSCTCVPVSSHPRIHNKTVYRLEADRTASTTVIVGGYFKDYLRVGKAYSRISQHDAKHNKRSRGMLPAL